MTEYVPTALQWIGCILVLIGYLGYGRGGRTGPAITILSCCFMSAWALTLNPVAWGILVLNVFILGINLYNLTLPQTANSNTDISSGKS